MIEELRSLVANEHGFVHKKLLSFGKTALGFVPGGKFLQTGLDVVGSLVGGRRPRRPAPRQPRRLPPQFETFRDPIPLTIPARRPSRRTLPRTITARPTVMSAAEKNEGRKLKFPDFITDIAETILGGGGRRTPVLPIPDVPVTFGPSTPCDPPLMRGPSGLCIAPTSPLGASRLVGEATMGRYGAALVPGSQIVDRATCLPGMQLGDDGLCYNRGNISNKQRMWPAGRKPLLTGGDMRAISTAARAGRRLELATKRLQKMGMMKKPAARRGAPRGHVARLEHGSQH